MAKATEPVALAEGPQTLYWPLNNEFEEIRVLGLRPGVDGDSIACDLITVARYGRDELQYEAVSYVWGVHPRVPQFTITVNHLTACVGENLYRCLEALRYPEAIRWLWVDALCINQEDIDERSEQVQRMYDIYRSAFRVLVWLGPATEASELAFDTIQDHHLRQRLRAPPRSADFDTGYDVRWLALSHLLNRDYWVRTWIVQEIKAQKNDKVLLQCGNRTIDLSNLERFLHLFVKRFLGGPVADQDVTPQIDSDQARINTGNPTQETTDGSEAHLRLTILRSRARRLLHILRTSEAYAGCVDPVPTLVELLRKARHLSCSVPRDKVFALAALTVENGHHKITVDYTSSDAVFYLDILAFCLGQHLSGETDAMRAAVFLRELFLTDAGCPVPHDGRMSFAGCPSPSRLRHLPEIDRATIKRKKDPFKLSHSSFTMQAALRGKVIDVSPLPVSEHVNLDQPFVEAYLADAQGMIIDGHLSRQLASRLSALYANLVFDPNDDTHTTVPAVMIRGERGIVGIGPEGTKAGDYILQFPQCDLVIISRPSEITTYQNHNRMDLLKVDRVVGTAVLAKQGLEAEFSAGLRNGDLFCISILCKNLNLSTKSWKPFVWPRHELELQSEEMHCPICDATRIRFIRVKFDAEQVLRITRRAKIVPWPPGDEFEIPEQPNMCPHSNLMQWLVPEQATSTSKGTDNSDKTGGDLRQQCVLCEEQPSRSRITEEQLRAAMNHQWQRLSQFELTRSLGEVLREDWAKHILSHVSSTDSILPRKRKACTSS